MDDLCGPTLAEFGNLRGLPEYARRLWDEAYYIERRAVEQHALFVNLVDRINKRLSELVAQDAE
jgi:hypothetical protein